MKLHSVVLWCLWEITCLLGLVSCSLAGGPVQVNMSMVNNTVLTYAFLDPGSSVTFCTEDLMDQLMANGKREKILVRMMGQEKTVTSFKISGM